MKKKKKLSKEEVLKKNLILVGPLSNNYDRGLGMMAGVVTTMKQLADEGVTQTVIDIGRSHEKLASKND
ncbi:MAG TPA: hypothetical protein VGQ59_05830 [Cyclobacteriaceae bacterium]|nr:hypothetical protein [Cyclobacteriaceae bacterium]